MRTFFLRMPSIDNRFWNFSKNSSDLLAEPFSYADGHGDDDGRDGRHDDDQECDCDDGYGDVRQQGDSGCDHEAAGDDDY